MTPPQTSTFHSFACECETLTGGCKTMKVCEPLPWVCTTLPGCAMLCRRCVTPGLGRVRLCLHARGFQGVRNFAWGARNFALRVPLCVCGVYKTLHSASCETTPVVSTSCLPRVCKTLPRVCATLCLGCAKLCHGACETLFACARLCPGCAKFLLGRATLCPGFANYARALGALRLGCMQNFAREV